MGVLTYLNVCKWSRAAVKYSMTNSWKMLASYEDQASAEAIAETLRAEGVPTRKEVQSPVPRSIEDVRVLVSADMLHRAKWVVNSRQVSESELKFAATGELGEADDESE